MDVERFVRERRGRWARLSTLLDAVERLPDRAVGQARLLELVKLYRQAGSDLNEARSGTANASLLARLNALVGRGYRFVYRRSRGRRLADEARLFFARDAPLAFRRERASVLAAAGAFVAGALLGGLVVLAHPGQAERLVPPEFHAESPRARVERIEASEERISSLEEAAAFSSFLFSHNIQVSFLAFSLGALTLVGGVWILFYNGVLLGAVAASYFADGVSAFFLAWVGPHGALELPAIVFGGAAGLRLGRALLLPGDLSTGAALRRALPSVWRMLLLTVVVLIVAGLVEGSFSQMTARTIPYSVKIGVAALLFTSLHLWLFGPRASGEAE
ncbi:MAG TPA: stage II sporulation protein M [Vicinamibacteria bacterium]